MAENTDNVETLDADAKDDTTSVSVTEEKSLSDKPSDSMELDLECNELLEPVEDFCTNDVEAVGAKLSNITVKQEPPDDEEYITNPCPEITPVDNDSMMSESNEHALPHTNYDNIQVKVIDIPEDDDLFSLLGNSGMNTPVSIKEEKTEEELRHSELYRYLVEEGPNSLRSSEAVVVTKKEIRSCEQTPLQSGDECDSIHSADRSKGYESETSGLETPEKRSSLDSSTPEPMLRQRRRTKTKKASPNQKRKKVSSGGGGSLSAKTCERLEKSRSVTEKWLNDLKLPESVSLTQKVTLDIGELNKYMTCGMCKGYLYEASTITECMHTFCKNCIVRHCMEVSLHCPVCHILIHPTDPFVNIRLDRMIQDIVYKILPNVAQTEMRRIEEFYTAHPEVEQTPELERPKSPKSSPKDKMSSEMMSLLLEQEGEGVRTDTLEKKFVRVAGSTTINNVCNFLKMKLKDSPTNKKVEMFCCGDMIEDNTLTLDQLPHRFFTGDEGLLLLQYRLVET